MDCSVAFQSSTTDRLNTMRGVDATGVELQIPVPAHRCRPGQVVASRHVGSGEARQRLHQRPALRAGRHVAAVDQDVRVAAQRTGPALDLGGVLQQRVEVQAALAQLHRAIRAVRDDVHGADVFSTRKGLGDLPDAVLAGIEQHHLDVALAVLAADTLDQLLVVGRRRIDEDDLVASCLRAVDCRLAELAGGLDDALLGLGRKGGDISQPRREVGGVKDPWLDRLDNGAP